MKKLFFAFCFIFSIIASNIVAQNRSIEFNHGTFSEILAQAKKENKIVYIDCFTVWCGPCKWMAKNVFTNDTVAEFYNKNFINAKIDMEKGEGIELAKKYGINAYPTMLYLSSDGTQLHRVCGSAPVQDFIKTGEAALSTDKQLATISKNFKNGKVNADLASNYFSMLENACQSYNKEVEEYFTNVKEQDFHSFENWSIIYKYVNDYYSPVFQNFEKNKAVFAKHYNTDSVESLINHVYTSGLYSSIQNKDMVVYEQLKTKLRSSKTKDAEKIIAQADIKLFQRSGDMDKYAKAASTYISNYSMENAYELNSYAWTFYEQINDKTMLENAAKWAKKATELEDNYPYNDTYAAVLYKLGKKNEAKAIAEKAIELAKKSGDDSKETQELLVKINALK
jgi:thiol-disulfide isomerase/thioredoxin